MIFSGATREPVARGLTRPHSARLHGGELWVDNSGYGEVGRGRGRRASRPSRGCPGWTRGLALRGRRRLRRHLAGDPALPRSYAPGLDVDRSVCGVARGRRRHRATCSAALTWPDGNQIFAVERVPRALTLGLPVPRRAPAAARPSATSSTAFDRRDPEEIQHEHDFRLLMIGAMYENGGNTTHRFLDGHPQLFVYPFESQLGTRLVNDAPRVDVPGQVPLAGVRARRDAGAGLPRDHRRGGQGPRAHAAREQVPRPAVRPRRRRAARALRRARRARPAARAANNVAAFFRATFDAWKDFDRSGQRGRSTSATARSSSSTPSKILDDLPNGALPARRPQPVVGLRRHEEAPGAAVARDLHARLDAQPALRAALRASAIPDRMHIVRTEDVMADSGRRRSAPVCEALGLERRRRARRARAGTARRSSEVYPWGTIRTPTPGGEPRHRARSSRAEERDEVARRARGRTSRRSATTTSS